MMVTLSNMALTNDDGCPKNYVCCLCLISSTHFHASHHPLPGSFPVFQLVFCSLALSFSLLLRIMYSYYHGSRLHCSSVILGSGVAIEAFHESSFADTFLASIYPGSESYNATPPDASPLVCSSPFPRLLQYPETGP